MENEALTGTADRPAALEPLPTQVTTDQLDEVVGGLQFIFKLVAVKTISWAHDD